MKLVEFIGQVTLPIFNLPRVFSKELTDQLVLV